METLEETKAYNARQPRDDHGRWSYGAGGISAGHAAHVMRSEGISDEKAAAVLAKIKDGTHTSREDVLAHIDSIHAAGKAPNHVLSVKELSAAIGADHEKVAEEIESVKRGWSGTAAKDVAAHASQLANIHKNRKNEGWEEIGSSFLHHTLEGKDDSFKESANAEYRKFVDRQKANEEVRQMRAAGVPDDEIRQRLSPKYPHITAKSDDETTMPDDTLIAFGEGIKSVEETADSYKFGAFLVVFDSPDISNYRDSFTKSTDFGFEDGDTRPILYNHGLDGTFGKSTIGKARLYLKDAGVWMEGEIKKRKDYLEKHIERVGEGLKATVRHRGIEAPMFGASSGSAAHSVVREAKGTGHEIKQWFLAEASITPTPAEPQTACMSLKSLIELEETETGEAEDEWKKYDPRQPRDDAGRWSEGGASTGLTAGHAVAVMRAEGITDEASHAEVARAIEAGVHTSPEQVLRHIDRIHTAAAANAALNGRPQPLGSRAGAMAEAHEVAMGASLPEARENYNRARQAYEANKAEYRDLAARGASVEERNAHLAKGVRVLNALNSAQADLGLAKHLAMVTTSPQSLTAARDKAHASVAAAHGVRQKIMDARNASLQMGRRVTKSDDEDDLDALFEAWDGHAAAALEVLQTELAPEEVKTFGATNQDVSGALLDWARFEAARNGVTF